MNPLFVLSIAVLLVYVIIKYFESKIYSPVEIGDENGETKMYVRNIAIVYFAALIGAYIMEQTGYVFLVSKELPLEIFTNEMPM